MQPNTAPSLSGLTVSANSGVLPAAPSGTVARFAGVDAEHPAATVDAFGGSPTFVIRRAQGTATTPGALTNSLTIGGFGVSGYRQTQYSQIYSFLTARTSEAWTDGACGFEVQFRTVANGGIGVSTRLVLENGGHLRFAADNAYTFGTASFRAKELFSANGVINTSDARLKTDVRPLTDAEIAAAKALAREIGVFQWLASVAAKGEDVARQHVGMTV